MIAFMLFVACEGEPPKGWVVSEKTGGPTVVYDVLAEPLADIPLPNNQATRLDPTTATGRRLNIGTIAPTEHEVETRKTFNKGDGFGTYAPIFLSFDKPLDVADLYALHANNDDFRDDAVFLLNTDPNCKRYGEEVALDIGKKRYPQDLYKAGSKTENPDAPDGELWNESGNLYFPFDDKFDRYNILFSERNEDKNGNGILDEGEDADHDGRLDIANFIDPTICDGKKGVDYHRCVADNLMTFYDRQSNRLILRPLWPLEQRCTYSVVLTKRLKGEDGKAIQSPFPYVNPQGQTADVMQAAPFLGRYGLSEQDIAFAWSFTTGSMTADLEELRKGLYGHGVFSRLADEFPVSNFSPWNRGYLSSFSDLDGVEEKSEEKMIDGGCAGSSLTWLWGPYGLGEWSLHMCAVGADLSSMGGVFGGQFKAPNLLADKDGQATEAYPADDDERWELDHMTGEALYGESDVTFWCGLPQELDTTCSPGNPEGKPFCKPFPVIMYAHGYGGSRAEITLHMGRHTAMGYAMCSLDSYGHGLNRWREDAFAGTAILVAGYEMQRHGVPELAPMVTIGRDRDLNNDGLSDPGADMWSADLFHTRDMVRQSVLEYMQFVRILRSMDGVNEDDSGSLLGDIDGDGVVDLGGPQNTLGMWGISLGGILSGVLAGAEPSLDTVSPNAGGAGLTDISTRSRQGGVPEAVIMPMMGQLIVGCLPVDDVQRPVPTGEMTDNDCLRNGEAAEQGGVMRLAFISNDNASDRLDEFASVDGIEVGDTVVVTNLRSGEEVSKTINNRGFFRLGIASDALGPIERRPLLGAAGDESGNFLVADPAQFGDRLRIEFYRGETLLHTVDQFQQQVTFQGSVYMPDSTLVALQEGMGLERNDPDLGRFIMIAQQALASADPGVWGAHTFMEPLDYSYDPNARGTRVLMMPTAGDVQVPANTGVAMGRVSGLFGSWMRDESLPPEYGWREMFMPDERYGVSIDQYLVDSYVVEGSARLERYDSIEFTEESLQEQGLESGLNHGQAIFDVDDVSDGTALFSCGGDDWSGPSENGCSSEYSGMDVFFPVPNPGEGKALRHNIQRSDGSYDAFRIPLLRPAGQHGIYNAQSFRVFDADAYMVNFTVRYLGSRARSVAHEAGCDCSASNVPVYEVNGEVAYQSLGDRSCEESDIKLCDEECANWGIVTPEITRCEAE